MNWEGNKTKQLCDFLEMFPSRNISHLRLEFRRSTLESLKQEISRSTSMQYTQNMRLRSLLSKVHIPCLIDLMQVLR